MINRFVEEELFEKMELFDDKTVLFTEARVNREDIPEGLYVYELRDNDQLSGDPCELKRRIVVNFFGTVIANEPLLRDDEEYKLISTEEWGFMGEESTIAQFMLESKPESVAEKERPIKKTVTVKATWEFEADVEELSPEFVDIPGLAVDLAKRELKNLIETCNLSEEDFDYTCCD